MTVGENIKRIRKERGLTQQDLGDRLGMTQSAIWQFESDKTSPKLETVEKIAVALGVTAFDLMGAELWNIQAGPEKLAELQTVSKDSPIEIYLKSQGFAISPEPLKWHWENENDPPEEQVQIVDEWGKTLSKDGHTATFTDAEFEELQAGAKEAIEGKFFKKVLEQQKK